MKEPEQSKTQTIEDSNLEGAESSEAEVRSEGVPSLDFIISPTVQDAFRRFGEDQQISASAITSAILEKHSEYSKGMASKLSIRDTAQIKPASGWLNEIKSLYDTAGIMRFSKSERRPVLHGRLAIVGLCLLDPDLRNQLVQEGVLDSLIAEIKEMPFKSILSEKGLELFMPPESVPNQPDNPVSDNNGDYLGRNAYAKYLSRRINAIPSGAGAYSFLLYGPWGSGKSTLLNFIHLELEKDPRWHVTEFNAWRQQHIQPPWWSLLEHIYQDTKQHLSFFNKFREKWWRLNTGRIPYIFGLIVVAWIVVILFSIENKTEGQTNVNFWSDTAGNISKILAFVVTIWGVIVSFSQSLLFGSAKAAQNFIDLNHDPMNSIKKRFNNLIARLQNKRLVVFIDDLDRCQSSYVVRLLEGIQTLFRDIPIVFVIAADMKWLNACYEETYVKLKDVVHEPGKGLGTLFLEKVFQFTAPVPGIPKEMKELFWKKLIGISPAVDETALKKARQESKDVLKSAKNEQSVLESIEESKNDAYYMQLAIREEAVLRLAAPDVMERTEHTLRPFYEFLEPNPRAMKRLVNAYSVNRSLSVLLHLDIDRERLALWTILSMRWPIVSEYLEVYPEKADKIIKNDFSDIRHDLKELVGYEEITKILNGGPTICKLDSTHVRQCSLLNGEQ